MNIFDFRDQLIGDYASYIKSFIQIRDPQISDFVQQKPGGTHMTFSILKQLPMLPPNQYPVICKWDHQALLGDWIFPGALELTYTAWDLETFAKDCGYDGPPFRWNEERRFLLHCELDAAYFHLYGSAAPTWTT